MFPQWTKAVAASAWISGNGILKGIAVGGSVAAVFAAIVLAALQPWCLFFAAEIGWFAGAIYIANCWLYDRLIANPLDQAFATGPTTDVTVIGVLVDVEPIGGSFPDNYDTDYCFNLLLQNITPATPDTPTYTEPPYPGPYGYVMKEQLAIHTLQLANAGGYGMSQYTGHTASLPAGTTTESVPVVHCEIEGPGMHDLYVSSLALLPITIAALIATLVIGAFWPWGTILSALIALLAFLASLFASNDDAGPSDVAPTISGGPLTSLNQSSQADVLMVTGTWVYDIMHSGWNELHPVKAWQRVWVWQGAWSLSMSPAVGAAYVAMKQAAMAPATKAAQQGPQNQWGVHPLIDGCGAYSEGTIP
jgi:hypothetical protein